MDSSSTTFKAAVCGKKFRKASWVCFFINTFNQQSGINAINVYAGRLLQTMDNESNGTFPISVTVGTQMVGLANGISASLAIFAIGYLGRKTLFVWG